MVIGVENVWNNFLLSPLEMARFLDEIDSPFVRAYFDIGNVVRTGEPADWIRTLGSRIARGNSVRMTPQALTPALLQGLEKLGGLAEARGQTLAQLALSWVLSAPGVTSVLVGASSAAQLRENAACLAAGPLSRQEREAAAAVFG